MSQRKTRGNPNFGRRANAPTPAINNSTPAVNNPTMATNNPNSADPMALAPMSSNPKATLPIASANVGNPGSSNNLANSMGMAK